MNHFDFTGCRVTVLGDLMLDKYLSGSVGRLSPEAPVAVLLRESERAVLGGAANVVANIASLGATVEVIGVVGADEAGTTLSGILSAYPNVSTRHLVVDPARTTTCKTRVMSGFHQLVRIDTETSTPVTASTEDAVVAALAASVAWADVVVISDYAKGLCSDRIIRAAIDLAANARKASIVDPKRRDFAIYRNATLIKPNRRELADATGLPCRTDQEAEAAAAAAISATNAAILLTRSEQGMSYFAKGENHLHLRTTARDVFDVSGAGDTVVALVALGIAARLHMSEAMRLANVAAGLVVNKIGTAALGAQELDAALEAESHRSSATKGSVVSLMEAVARTEEWRGRGLKVGFTNGCYDLLHPGHVSLLRQAAAACDRLIVGINSDASVRRLKGSTRPVQSEQARACVLGALAAVDLVVVFAEDTPAACIDALLPNVLVKGADYSEGEVVGADVVKRNGGRVLLVPIVEGQSTTSMISRATQHGGRLDV